MIYPGRVRNGHIVLDDAIALPEGARVEIVLLSDFDIDDASTLYERLRPVVGTLSGLPRDGARNLDHYLYGTGES